MINTTTRRKRNKFSPRARKLLKVPLVVGLIFCLFGSTLDLFWAFSFGLGIVLGAVIVALAIDLNTQNMKGGKNK